MSIPVILDTDIGTDIDDTWALAMLLNCPELDVRLITTATGDTTARARIVARFLAEVGRTDIPIGIGPETAPLPIHQADWGDECDLKQCANPILADGAQAIVDTLIGADETVTVLGIGPLTTVAAALERQPSIAERGRFVGMHGSVYRGYNGAEEPHAEYNVKQDIPACRRVFRASWPKCITPLDTCGLIILEGERYQRVRQSRSPAMQALLANYRLWLESSGQPLRNFAERSSTLFDTVAVYLACATELVDLETVPLTVTDDGFTRPDAAAGDPVECAVGWRNQAAFKELLVARLLAGDDAAT